jgi:short-subunit dehydrogenase
MKNILITGASKGIGRAIAVKLASTEAHIFIHGRDQKGLAETSKAMEKKGGRTTLITSDISTAEGCEKIVNTVRDLSVDVLIINAGVAYVQPIEKQTLDEWNRTVAINVTAAFIITKGFLPRMKSGSSIVNILSIAAKTAFPGWSSYCMSKHALRGFSESIREELRPKGIRVINIYPASTDTAIWGNVSGDWDRTKMMSPDDVAEAVSFAVSQREGLMVDDISIEGMAGRM